MKSVPEVAAAPKPIGPYSPVVEANGFVFLSGQVGGDPADSVTVQTSGIMENLQAILGELGLGFGDVVKTTIFLADMGDFADVNEIYGGYFTEDPPARSTVQAGGLPKGYAVEIEIIAAR